MRVVPFAFVLASALAVLALGCGDDGNAGAGGDGVDGGAVEAEDSTLSVELYWDTMPARNVFVGGSCEDSGVDWMEWRLSRVDAGSVAASAGACANAIDVIGLAPGDYDFEIMGSLDDAGGEWSSFCPGLRLGAKDVSYNCDVFRSD